MYSYCKQCYHNYIIEKFCSYKEQYIQIKNSKAPITCDCGKTITKPFYYKNHLLSNYQKNV